MSTPPRRDTRLPAKLAVAYRTQGAFLVSYSVNLSRGGIFIESETSLPIGTEVALRLEVPNVGAFDLAGVVAWIRQASPDGMPDGMGFQLHDLDERYGAAIDKMVQEFEGLTVLVLAGTPERLTQLGRYVRSIISCEVLEAMSLEEAEVALAGEPDLVILDIERAASLSARTVEQLRRVSAAPVILLSSDLGARELGRSDGADEVLETPPSFQALQAAVIRTLSRPAKIG
ncbi:MAG: TIGR02266 family protein [Polyangia bacterium]